MVSYMSTFTKLLFSVNVSSILLLNLRVTVNCIFEKVDFLASANHAAEGIV